MFLLRSLALMVDNFCDITEKIGPKLTNGNETSSLSKSVNYSACSGSNFCRFDRELQKQVDKSFKYCFFACFGYQVMLFLFE